jgi:uncharacterized protein (DUF1015 family)
MELKFKILNINILREHERVDFNRLEELLKEIMSDGMLKKPILVDKNTLTILDGHHRLNVLKKLGLRKIPVVLVDYNDPHIVVRKWGTNRILDKREVLKVARCGKLFPPKTTQHFVLMNDGFEHVEALQREVNIPLEKLR